MAEIILFICSQVIEVIGIIVAAVIPVIIMRTTFKHDNAKLEVEKAHHHETQRLQQEEIRVSKCRTYVFRRTLLVTSRRNSL